MIATFGAGCFWCIEAIFQELTGVKEVKSGYTGGEKPNPTYKEVCSGTTGHAEVAQITFDPNLISYPELLEVFWSTHDPTTLNRQGNDIGTQYRSVIYYHSEEQKAQSIQSVEDVAKKLWDKPIVTQIEPIDVFYPAENYHDNYYNLNPNKGYCRIVINPKVKKFREKFAGKLKKTTYEQT